MVSHTHRYPASAVVQRVSLGSSLLTCVWGVGFRFYGRTLTQSSGGAPFAAALSATPESVEICKNIPTRRCYSLEEDSYANGAALRTCLDCFNATGRTAST